MTQPCIYPHNNIIKRIL